MSFFDDDSLCLLVVPPLSSAIPQHPYNSQPEEQNGERVSDNVTQHGGLIIYGATVGSHHANAYKAFAETLTTPHVEMNIIEINHNSCRQIADDYNSSRGCWRRPAPFDINSKHQSQGGDEQRQNIIKQERAATRPPVCQSRFDFLHHETTNLRVVSPSLSSSPLTRTYGLPCARRTEPLMKVPLALPRSSM